MTTQLTTMATPEIIESVVLQGDLAQLSPEQRVSYYKATCESLGLNPLTKPFDYIRLKGKLTLYAKRDATDQLRNIHKISINITSRDKHEDVYIVSAKAKTQDGREDESTGVVTIQGLKGDDLANALMKAETKAKRRVTLSIVGLGWIDETETETIDNAEMVETQIIDGVVDVSPGDWLPSPPEFFAQVIADFGAHLVNVQSPEATDEIKSILKNECGFTGFKSSYATDMYNCLCEYFGKQQQAQQQPTEETEPEPNELDKHFPRPDQSQIPGTQPEQKAANALTA